MFQVASRRVIQVEAVYMLLFGMIGKFGALFVTIPEPVIGGVFLVMFGEYCQLFNIHELACRDLIYCACDIVNFSWYY